MKDTIAQLNDKLHFGTIAEPAKLSNEQFDKAKLRQAIGLELHRWQLNGSKLLNLLLFGSLYNMLHVTC